MLKKVFLVAAMAGLLSACADRWDVEGASMQPNHGSPFEQALQDEYVALAQAERAESDWRDTAYFVRKAEAAARGETVLPTALDERHIAADKVPELASAREALIARLDTGARIEQAAAAARAQAAGFDCWMQEQEEGHQPADIAACRAAFDAAMKGLQPMAPKAEVETKAEPKQPMPAPLPAPYIVYFPTGSAKLSAEAMDAVRSAADAWRDNKPVTVVVAGHADTVGDATFNILLSQKRSEAVAEALAEAGVEAEAMALEAYGEEQPRIPTPDSTPEQANRRVEITFRK